MQNDLIPIKEKVDLIEFIGRYVSLEKESGHMKGLCPFHNEKSPSFVVYKERFKCFGCGASGDVFDFLTGLGKTIKEAKEMLSSEFSVDSEIAQLLIEKREKQEKKEKQVFHVTPVPAGAGLPNFNFLDFGLPYATYIYRDQKGFILGYVCCFKNKEGKKMVIPLIYALQNGRYKWMWHGFKTPRPLYNLPQLFNSEKTDRILLVEGEKTAEAASKLYPYLVVTTWPGGSNAFRNVDFTPLYGRKVIFWPDNDKPGDSAMIEIYKMIGDKIESRFVKNPAWAFEGWDFADSEWGTEEAHAYLKENLLTFDDFFTLKNTGKICD